MKLKYTSVINIKIIKKNIVFLQQNGKQKIKNCAKLEFS